LFKRMENGFELADLVCVLCVNEKAVVCKHIQHRSATRARCCMFLGMGGSVVAAFAHTSAASALEQIARNLWLESRLRKTLIL
jgi:hypothetical protein